VEVDEGGIVIGTVWEYKHSTANLMNIANHLVRREGSQ